MSKKEAKIPDSDTNARHRRLEVDAELTEDPPESLEGRQTSNKAGGHSTVEKLAAGRTEFEPRPGAGPVAGAFGSSEPQPSGTGSYRCSACGRFFDVEADLRSHESDCRAAKEATTQGARELVHEDNVEHPPNDRGR